MNEKDQRKLERKIFKDFITKREFSAFEKDSLRALRATLDAAYSFYHEDFYSYLKDNKATLDILSKTLDNESKSVIESILKDAEYISNHNFVDMLRDLFNKDEEVFKHLEMAKSYGHFKLYEQNYYEQNIFDYKHGLILLPEETLDSLNNKDFIDGGAFVGDSAIIFENYFNPKRIYAFEPDEVNYFSLLEAIKLNNLKKVVPIKMGVGAYETKVNFFPWHSLSKIDPENGNYKIEVITIDKYVYDRNLDVGLIKLDIEGLELDALKGAIRTINEFKPVLSISIYHTAQQFIDVIKFVQELSLEYKIIIRHLSDLIPIMETYLIAW